MVWLAGLSLPGLIGKIITTWFYWKGLSLPGLIIKFFYTWYGGNAFFFPLFYGKLWCEVSNLMGILSPHGLMGMFYLHMVWWEGFISTWFVGKVYLTRFILSRFNSFISPWSDWSVYLYLIWWEGFISTWFDGKFYLQLVSCEVLSPPGWMGRFYIYLVSCDVLSLPGWMGRIYLYLVSCVVLGLPDLMVSVLTLPGLIGMFIYSWFDGNV